MVVPVTLTIIKEKNPKPNMASKKQALFSLLSLLALSFAITPMQAGQIAIYWGQNGNEGTLTEACDSGDYEIVLLAFLIRFGNFRDLGWNFAGHCGDWSPCTKLEPEIKHCQEIGKKVFLSLGGDSSDYTLVSAEDAKDLASKLYSNFLSGQSGPLGAVTLDGIDFDIEHGSVNYYDDLARELDTLRREHTYFYLSAAPQCPIPDRYLDTAIKTGLFDYVWVQFYNNPPCQYSESSGTSLLLSSWNDWASLVFPNNSLFLGLPASSAAAPSGGFIPAHNLTNDVLPVVKQTANYGGVMLWSRYWDIQTNPTYSHQIKDYVLTLKAAADALLNSLSVKFYRLLPPYLRM